MKTTQKTGMVTTVFGKFIGWTSMGCSDKTRGLGENYIAERRGKALDAYFGTIDMKNYLWTETARTLVFILTTAVVVFPIHAALIVSDDFSTQTSGNLAGQSGGQNWGTSGNTWYGGNNVQNSTPRLTYAGLQTSGNAARASGGDNGVFRYMNNNASPANGTFGGANGGATGFSTIWISVLMQVSGSSSYAGISLFNGNSTENTFFGARSAQSVFGIERSGVGGGNGNSVQSASTLTFIAVELIFGATSVEEKLFINPTPGSTAPTSAAVDLLNQSLFTFDTVRIQSGGSETMNIGNLRFGTTFADVAPVPEPIALALPLFGGLVLTGGLTRRFLSRQQAPTI